MTSPADERRAKALELHLAGASYSAIARAVGYANKGTAHTAVKQALKESASEDGIGEAARSELARLDAMLTGMWPKARKGDLGAVAMVLRIEERRALILGRDTTAETTVEPPRKETGLSDFEKRLREREQRATQQTSGAGED